MLAKHVSTDQKESENSERERERESERERERRKKCVNSSYGFNVRHVLAVRRRGEEERRGEEK